MPRRIAYAPKRPHRRIQTFIKKIKKLHTTFANKINIYIFAIELKL